MKKPSCKLPLDPNATPEQLLPAISEANSSIRTLYTTFIVFMLYAAIIAFGTNDESLLRNSIVAVPLLSDAKLPSSAFFAVVPWILVAVHLELLLHFDGLTAKIGRFNALLTKLTDSKASALRLRLPGAPVVAWQGPDSSWLHSFVVCFTLAACPLSILLILQLSFLPYQSEPITWAQRVALIIDFLLLLRYWPRRPEARPGNADHVEESGAVNGVNIKTSAQTAFQLTVIFLRKRWRHLKQALHCRLSLCVVVLFALLVLSISVLVATIPDEPLELKLGEIGMARYSGKQLDSLLRGEDENASWCIRTLRNLGEHRTHTADRNDFLKSSCPAALLALATPFHRTISISGKRTLIGNEVSADKLEAIIQAMTKTGLESNLAFISPLDLGGRTLKYANFDDVMLFRANLKGANMKASRFIGTHLQGANMEDSNLESATLTGAELAGVNLSWAKMNDSTIQSSTDFRFADLLGTRLMHSTISHIDFSETDGLAKGNFSRSTLDSVYFQGAQLHEANFMHSTMGNVYFQGASLEWADFRGLELEGRVNFEGANLRRAKLQGNDLSGSVLYLTDLREADLRGTLMPSGAVGVLLDKKTKTGLYDSKEDMAELNKQFDAVGKGSDSGQLSRIPKRHGQGTHWQSPYVCIGPNAICNTTPEHEADFARLYGRDLAKIGCKKDLPAKVAENVARRFILDVPTMESEPFDLSYYYASFYIPSKKQTKNGLVPNKRSYVSAENIRLWTNSDGEAWRGFFEGLNVGIGSMLAASCQDRLSDSTRAELQRDAEELKKIIKYLN